MSGEVRGGARRGRRRHVPPLVKCHINLTEAQRKLLRMWGRGDISAGVRWLITAAEPMIKRRSELEQP